MENHHLAGAFSLLKHPDMNFLQAMPKATYDRLRKLVIELVLGTDMKQHFSIIGQFTALHRTGGDSQATGRKMALKCSDLGHLAAPLPVHLAWVSRLEAEFFAQGDAERAQGLTISPLCDRTKQGITKSQVGFFEFVALPLFTNFTARFTAAKPLLRGVMANYHHWQAQAAVAAEPQAPAQGG
ncbi:3'5'-cyclic nucleotide phosphodiesterase, partial [Haematococcus lacustris]